MPLGPIADAALWVAIASIPLVFVGLTFLHAALRPQWVWAMAGRTQIVWLATLLLGSAIIPLGIPAAVYYIMKVRPLLLSIESGDMSGLSDGLSPKPK